MALRGELEMGVAENAAGLARGEIETALDHARAALDEIEREGVESLEFPLLVYLSCYEALRAAGQAGLPAEPPAREVLAAAHALLMERAGSIDDPALRAAMLERVEINRRVLEEWAKG